MRTCWLPAAAGRQAASVAATYPDAKVTAIDISETSLHYARRQCTAPGITNVKFITLDLHDVAALGERFHAIFSAGVLHHLPDPERGLQILAKALLPSGVMQIMVYNRLNRLMVAGTRTLISELLQESISDDLLKRVRERILRHPENGFAASVMRSRDFAMLAGTLDLLLHRHEDSFDATRIGRALDLAGLQLLRFDIAWPAIAGRYDAASPGDPDRRNIKAWSRFTKTDPDMISNHYRF